MDKQQAKRKPGRPKRTDTAHTMEQILHTASVLFMEIGFEKVSLDSVAKACGVTKASVYYYFDNKAILFTECLLFVLGIARRSTEKLMTEDGPLYNRLLKVAERHMQNTYVDFETMMREAAEGLNEDQISRIREGESALHTVLQGAFQEAIDAGEIRSADAELLSHSFTAMMTVRNRKEVVNEHRSAEQAAKEIMLLFWHGIAPIGSNGQAT
ncbi:TetR/AcrR family transcriptional regulator [Paenibacillus sp. GCM10023252]|uniref:TetR/AcrR family transcriptional regulator n=1 Tax=Paenibacillus sp. GCM10023252 TaxID=3252649 RepID=UPI0036070D17